MSSDAKNLHAIETTHANGLMARMIEGAPEGTVISPVENAPMRAAFKVQRPGFDPKPFIVDYTLIEAVQAGHFDDPDRRRWWTNYTRDMVWAAAVRRLAKSFPHLTTGGTTLGEHIENGPPPKVEDGLAA